MINCLTALVVWACFSPVSARVSQEYIKVAGTSAEKLSVVGGKRIAWDYRSLEQVSKPGLEHCSYGRMVELHDGTLLCVYEAQGSVMASRSVDEGKTWEEPTAVAWKQDGINMSVPEVLELKDHSILACYNPRPFKISGERTFGIRTRKSFDGGKTWSHGRLVYEAGHRFGDGCWEPAALQMPDGEIQLFFANESDFRESEEQNISLMRSRDGGLSWTDTPEVVSFLPHGRDGMPVPLLLDNGHEIVCAIEESGWGWTLQPAILRTTVENDWAETIGGFSRRREQPLMERLDFRTYAGAPYLGKLNSGETLLSYQGTEGRRNSMHFAEMKVLMGDKEARNFGKKTVPFRIPKEASALWNSLCVLRNGDVVAVTTTHGFGGGRGIWMIRGHVIPEPECGFGTPVVDGKLNDGVWAEGGAGAEAGGLPLFVGHYGNGNVRAGVCHDDENLYVACRVSDAQIFTGRGEPEFNDGVAVSLARVDGGGKDGGMVGAEKLDDDAFRFFLSADNLLVAKQGKDGYWVGLDGDEAGRVRHASVITGDVYEQEWAISLEMLGMLGRAGVSGVDESSTGGLVMNVSLTQNGGEVVPEYRESLSGCDEDKPYTWMPVLF